MPPTASRSPPPSAQVGSWPGAARSHTIARSRCSTIQLRGTFLSTGLQSLTDALSQRTGFAVVIDDPELRTVAHSKQREPVDALRRDSILNRTISLEARRWLSNHGIHTRMATVSATYGRAGVKGLSGPYGTPGSARRP